MLIHQFSVGFSFRLVCRPVKLASWIYSEATIFFPCSANIPMTPKMSLIEGTNITSKLTTKMRQNAMRTCLAQWKGLSGKKIWSTALRIYKYKRRTKKVFNN